MKTNKIIKASLTTVIALALVFTSCRKREMQDKDEDTAITTQADDSQDKAANVDDASSDADNAVSACRNVAGNPTIVQTGNTVPNWPCDASVDSSLINQGIITLTFNGSGCNGKVRTGQIKYTVVNYSNGARWRDVSAQLTINFIDYKVTRNGKSMLLNGTHNLVNVSGGLVNELSADKPSIVRTVSSNNMNITFDDNTTRQWSVAKRRTWDYNGGNYKLTITGEATVSSLNSVCAWGTNRKGKSFITQITSPVVVLKNCGWGKPVSGVKVHTVEDKTATVTLGTNANGDVDSGNCPNNFKVEWTGRKGKHREHIGTYR